jgi:hypothetical protein
MADFLREMAPALTANFLIALFIYGLTIRISWKLKIVGTNLKSGAILKDVS